MLTEQISEIGHFSINYRGSHAKVYIGSLAAFLVAEKIEVKNLDKQVIESVNGTAYLNHYVTEFKRGAEYFDSRYRVSPNILFGSEAKEFGESLHHQYFHSKKELGGWNYWKKWVPQIITHKVVGDYGYHAGIISSFEEMAYEYSDLFNKYVFINCKQNEEITHTEFAPVNPTSTATDEQVKLSHSQIAMLHHYNNQSITRNNAETIAHRYGQTSGQKLLDIYGRMTSPLERTATAKNTIKNFCKVIPLLSGKGLELANKELVDAKKNNSKRLEK